MAETVDVPAVGSVKKKYVLMSAALVAGIVGYAWWKRGTAAPVDVPAYTGADVSADGIADTAGGVAGGSANSGGADHNDGGLITSDSQWAQRAGEMLSGAYDPAAVAEALGAYLTHQPLTTQQAAIVRAAIGMLGYPPGGAYAVTTGGGVTPSALTEPKGLHVRSRTGDTVTLQWDTVAGAANYRLFREGVSENVGASNDPIQGVAGLRPNTAYRFRVAAVDASGKTGPYSAWLSARTSGATLKAPTGLKASGVTAHSVRLTWSKVAGADGYRVYRSDSGYNVGASKDGSVTVSGLAPSRTYRFAVRAESGNTIGPQGRWISVKTKKK